MKIIRLSLFIFLNIYCTAKMHMKNIVNPLLDSRQLVVVTSPNDATITGTLRTFEWRNGHWEPVAPPHPVTLGRSGLAWGHGLLDERLAGDNHKHEGDGKSPAGIYRFGTAFGYADPDSVHFQMPYVHVTQVTQCIEDSQSKYYNQIVDNTRVAVDWKDGDYMCRKDELYKWGIFVEHNTPASEGMGSCIFFHLWRAPDKPTAGCTGMTEENILQLLNWMNPAANPLLVQLTEQDYLRLADVYGLPVLK